MVTREELLAWIRPDALPTPFCPGCGHGLVLRALLTALVKTGADRRKTCFVSGIGCSGWISSPLVNADTLHTTHGRPLAFATGLKLAREDLAVVVVGGDGDLLSIGGNHLIHAARRNTDLLCVMADNSLFAMTGGQVSPTTPTRAVTTTTPAGNEAGPFDAVRLVTAAGAAFAVRCAVSRPRKLAEAFATGLETRGFAFVQALSQCPTHAGRASGAEEPYDAMRALDATRETAHNRPLC